MYPEDVYPETTFIDKIVGIDSTHPSIAEGGTKRNARFEIKAAFLRTKILPELPLRSVFDDDNPRLADIHVN